MFWMLLPRYAKQLFHLWQAGYTVKALSSEKPVTELSTLIYLFIQIFEHCYLLTWLSTDLNHCSASTRDFPPDILTMFLMLHLLTLSFTATDLIDWRILQCKLHFIRPITAVLIFLWLKLVDCPYLRLSSSSKCILTSYTNVQDIFIALTLLKC